MKPVFFWFTILDECIFLFCNLRVYKRGFLSLNWGILEITTASLIIAPVLRSWHCVPCSVDLIKLNEPNYFSLFCTNVFKLALLHSWLCCSSGMIYLGCIFIWQYLGKMTEALPKSMYVLFIASHLPTRLAALSKETRFVWSVRTNCYLWRCYFLGACKLIA